MAIAAGSRLGPYEVVGLLAEGGMGQVYRARDPRLDRDVAIKVLPGEFAADADRLRRFDLLILHRKVGALAQNEPVNIRPAWLSRKKPWPTIRTTSISIR